MTESPIEVLGVDHIYVTVSDLGRAEAFYDPVMRTLGFKKGARPVGGDDHVHYFNRVVQYTIRPARGGEHDPYRVGALHHLCFRVRDRTAVDTVWRCLGELGIDATEPAVYPYRPDYYATFFADPDGIRLEVVCDTEGRRTIRSRWEELDAFVNPVSKLGPPSTEAIVGSLHAGVPDDLGEEAITVLCGRHGARIERVVSRGHASPPGFWYDQTEVEWVLLVAGAARLELQGRPEPLTMQPGDWVLLPAHCRHRVAWTDPSCATIWLAAFFDE